LTNIKESFSFYSHSLLFSISPRGGSLFEGICLQRVKGSGKAACVFCSLETKGTTEIANLPARDSFHRQIEKRRRSFEFSLLSLFHMAGMRLKEEISIQANSILPRAGFLFGLFGQIRLGSAIAFAWKYLCVCQFARDRREIGFFVIRYFIFFLVVRFLPWMLQIDRAQKCVSPFFAASSFVPPRADKQAKSPGSQYYFSLAEGCFIFRTNIIASR